MTLATHILVAGAASKPFLGVAPLPIIFAVALASHYLIDAVPHGDYSLASINDADEDSLTRSIEPSFRLIALDAAKVALDAGLGTTAYWAFSGEPLAASSLPLLFAIVLGGILPDILHPLYYLFKHPPLTWAARVHKFMHTKLRLARMGYIKTALISQAAIIAIASAIIALY